MDEQSQQTLVGLLHGQRTAALGTVRDGAPLVSMVLYAPETDFSACYMHVSRLAQHTAGLLQNEQVSLMISQPDTGAQDPQTLARISVQGRVTALAQGSPDWERARALYLNTHPTAAMNFQLGDFILFRMEPQAARYVAGFGRIFNLSPERLREISGLPRRDN